jgi:phage shock protein A
MFEGLRSAFREAIENFNKELSREHIPESVDRLIVGMRDEIAEAKVQIGDLEKQIERTRAAVEKVKQEAATYRRRERMARDIEDGETAAVAADFAEKQEEHHRVLLQKVTAFEAELVYRRDEVGEMFEKVKEAQAKKDSLTATAGRSGARESLSEADQLFSELDRMAEKIDGERARGEAAEAMGDLDLGAPRSDMHIDLDAEAEPEADVDFDARLAELKRRMGEE